MVSQACHSFLLLLALIVSPAIAQVTPDQTLNTQVESQGNTFNITGGTTAGSNLFHSFSDFFIPQGREAFFNNSPGFSNIINRVTGGNISDIQGSIRSPSKATNLSFANHGHHLVAFQGATSGVERSQS